MAAAKKGARQVLMLDKRTKAAEVSELAIQKAAGVFTEVKLIPFDITNMKSVQKAARQITASCGESGLDVLFLNGGLKPQDEAPTVDSYDVQCQVYLSNFLLAKECYPLLETAAAARDEARVVSLTTLNRNTPATKLDVEYFATLQGAGALGGSGASGFFSGPNWERYHQTKLANVVFTMALHDRLHLAGSHVRAIVCDCGVVKSAPENSPDFEQSSLTSSDFLFGFAVAHSVENASLPALYACFSPDAGSGDFWGPSGFFSGEPTQLAKGGKFGSPCYDTLALDGPARSDLWDQSEAECGRFDIFPSA